MRILGSQTPSRVIESQHFGIYENDFPIDNSSLSKRKGRGRNYEKKYTYLTLLGFIKHPAFKEEIRNAEVMI